MNSSRERLAATKIEINYLINQRNYIYTALEEVPDTDFLWALSEIETFDQLWKEETPIVQIAKDMHRSEISVFLLALDRIAMGKNEPRKGWRIW